MLLQLTMHLSQLPKPKKRLPHPKKIKRQRRSRRAKLMTQKTMKTRKAIKMVQAMRPPTAFKKQSSTGTSKAGVATT